MKTAVNPQTGERLMLDEQSGQWMPMQAQTEQPAPQGTSFSDVVRGGLSGATLGFGDELRGGAFGLMNVLGGTGDFGESYRSYRDSERAELDRFRQESPGAALASELAGGLLTGGLGGKRAAGTALARNLAAAPVATRMGAASLAGGTAGAIAGAGEADTMADVPMQALKGGAVGAAIGPAIEGAVTGVQAASRALSPQRAAERTLRKAVQRGDMTLSQVRRKLQTMGPGAVLADVNEGVLTELDRLVNTPGLTRTRAIKQLSKRSGEQMDEILSASGKGQYFENLDAIKGIKERMASPLYERAYAKGVQHTKELDELFDGIEAVLPGAWKEGKNLIRMDAIGSGNPVPVMGDVVPNLHGWNGIKRYMDDRIGSLLRSGEKERAGSLIAIKRRLLKELDSQSPDYAVARGMWGGLKQFESVMEDGKSFMRSGFSSADLRHSIKGFSDADRLAYREGARQAIQDTLERAGTTHDASKFFRTPAMEAKIRSIFGRESRKILRTIDASAAKQRTFTTATRGSQTALRQAAQAEEGLSRDAMGAVADFALSSPTQASSGFVRKAIGKIPTSREATRDAIGNMLLEADPAKQQQILQWLMTGGKPQAPVTGAGLLTPIAAGGVGGLLATR